MKKNFLSGLIILLPIALTFFVLRFLLHLFTTPFIVYVERLLLLLDNQYGWNLLAHHNLFIFLSRILILLFIACLILILGYLGSQLMFRWFLHSMQTLMLRLPLINTIYRIIQDIVTAILSEKEDSFCEVVALPFPQPGLRAMGIVTGIAPSSLLSTRMKTVFIPTAPHPISGLLLLCHEEDLLFTRLPLEELVKYLVSCGIYVPRSPDAYR